MVKQFKTMGPDACPATSVTTMRNIPEERNSHLNVVTQIYRSGRHSSVVQRLATDWTVWGSNPGTGEIFRTRPDRLWTSPSLLYNGHRVSFPGMKWAGRGVKHPPPSSAEVQERVELYLNSPSGPSWSVIRRALPVPYLPHVIYTTAKCQITDNRTVISHTCGSGQGRFQGVYFYSCLLWLQNEIRSERPASGLR
jgi:hypothetical protein